MFALMGLRAVKYLIKINTMTDECDQFSLARRACQIFSDLHAHEAEGSSENFSCNIYEMSRVKWGGFNLPMGRPEIRLNVYVKFAKINKSPIMFISQQKQSLVEVPKILNSSCTRKSLSATFDCDVIEFYFENRFPMYFLFGCVKFTCQTRGSSVSSTLTLPNE